MQSFSHTSYAQKLLPAHPYKRSDNLCSKGNGNNFFFGNVLELCTSTRSVCKEKSLLTRSNFSTHAAVPEGILLRNQMLFEDYFITNYQEKHNLSSEEALIKLVGTCRNLARPPISNFQVAALAVGISGRVYIGVNLEFEGLPLSQSVHAEQFAIANAIQEGETGLKLLVVTHSPCGHCRQFLSELRGAGELTVIIANEEKVKRPLSELIPYGFGPSDLLSDEFPLLMEPRYNGIEFDSFISRDTLFEAALSAANKSYAPYSESPSGIAIQMRSGEILTGSYLESAAYNPSLPPLQSAIISLVSRGHVYEDIMNVVLIERDNAKVQFRTTLSSFLHRIAPEAKFKVELV